MTKVLAICGTMGSGKTTAVENIAAALPDCVSLHEDDFNKTTERSLEDIDAWWKRGADVGEFDLSALLTQLAVLCPDRPANHALQASNTSTTSAATMDQRTDIPRSPSARRRGGQQIVLLETHFGRLHPKLAPWIDFQCWIDVPADVALARKVAQLTQQMSATHDKAINGLRWIESFCNGYLTTTRKLFEMQRQDVRNQSEITINGESSPLDVCVEFLQRLPPEFRPE